MAASLPFDLTVRDEHGAARDLVSVYRSRRCVVVFLRHLGCRFCKHHAARVKQLRAAYLRAQPGGRVEFLLVAVGLPEHIASFRAESGWDGELYVCADHRAPAAGVYGTYGLRNGQEYLVDPRVQGPGGTGAESLAAGFTDGGYSGGGLWAAGEWKDRSADGWAGDALQLGGVFVLGPGNVCDFAFRSEYGGHVPEDASVLAALGASSTAQTPAPSSAQRCPARGWAQKLAVTTRAGPAGWAPSPPLLAAAAAAALGLLGRPRAASLAALAAGSLVARKQLGARASRGAPLRLRSVQDVDAEMVASGPEGLCTDCGYVPRLGMTETRSAGMAAQAARSLGFLPREEDVEVLSALLCYVREFLAKPHADVGRGGPVCPFIPKALRLDCLHLAVVRGNTREAVEQACLAAREQFATLEPASGNSRFFRAVVLCFPDVPLRWAGELIDGTQQRLKDDWVLQGLMLGEFHLLNNATGLRNSDFFPLRTPYPCLAMRHMVPSDLPFLKNKKDWVAAYLRQFESAENFAQAKAELRREAELELAESPSPTAASAA